MLIQNIIVDLHSIFKKILTTYDILTECELGIKPVVKRCEFIIIFELMSLRYN